MKVTHAYEEGEFAAHILSLNFLGIAVLFFIVTELTHSLIARCITRLWSLYILTDNWYFFYF